MTSRDEKAADYATKMRLTDYDFVRFVWSDIHGIARSKLIPARNVPDTCITGVQVYEGTQLGGPRGDVFAEIRTGNCAIMPDLNTICRVPWAGDEKKGIRIGQMLCEARKEESHEPLTSCTRSMCRRLLDQLFEEFGFTMKSGIEHEFILVDGESHKPVTDGTDIVSLLFFQKFETFFAEMSLHLYQVGVDIESMQNEFQQGQFELVIKADHGLKAIDASFVLKEAVKEISMQKGYVATFMTRPMVGIAAACSSGAHLNISLGDTKGANVFGEKTDAISETFRHFLAGLIAHAPAMTALCCPTVNCYRRLHQAWAPHLATWAVDNRDTLYRLRRMSTGGAFFESRLPSSGSNPYLAASAHLAAGMDGLRRKLELPPELDPSAVLLPSTLEEALVALETDDAILDALGAQFVKYYCSSKRQIELKIMSDVDITVLNDVHMSLEKEQYFHLL